MCVILLFGKGPSTVRKRRVELAACLVQWGTGSVHPFLVYCEISELPSSTEVK